MSRLMTLNRMTTLTKERRTTMRFSTAKFDMEKVPEVQKLFA